MPELLLFQRFEVPVDDGSRGNLLSFFAGDAAQQESFSRHCFSHGVDLCAAATALAHCSKEEEEEEEEDESGNVRGVDDARVEIKREE